MQWNVAQLLQANSGAVRTYSVDELEGRYKELDGKVIGTVRLMKTDRGILVRAPVTTRVWCSCSRCLISFSEPVSFEIDEVFYPVDGVFHEGKLAEPETDGEFTIDRHHILDLGEPVCQYALLSVPMKPLCTRECSGLCPTCGTNLNLETCRCPKGQVDPRWDVLRQMSAEVGIN